MVKRTHFTREEGDALYKKARELRTIAEECFSPPGEKQGCRIVDFGPNFGVTFPGPQGDDLGFCVYAERSLIDIYCPDTSLAADDLAKSYESKGLGEFTVRHQSPPSPYGS